MLEGLMVMEEGLVAGSEAEGVGELEEGLEATLVGREASQEAVVAPTVVLLETEATEVAVAAKVEIQAVGQPGAAVAKLVAAAGLVVMERARPSRETAPSTLSTRRAWPAR